MLVVAVAILLIISKDTILRNWLEHRIRSRTGMEASIGRFSSGLFSPVITIENLKLYNTAEFGGAAFLFVPELHLELDRAALARREIHVNLMRLNLAEIDVVRNGAGQTNIFSILDKLRKPSLRDRVGDAAADFDFTGIDVLNLSIGKAQYVDLKDARQNREVRADLKNLIFKNVKSKADAQGMLFMIWLRSGGKLSLGPNNFAKNYTDGKKENAEKTETAVRNSIKKAESVSKSSP
jgi:hypothetical protein